MDYTYLLNEERTSLLSREDLNILYSFLNSRYRVSPEEFKRAIEVNDCPFSQEGCIYEFIGVGGSDGNSDNIEEIILAIRRDDKNGIGIIDKDLNFNVVIEPINSKVKYISNRCIEVRNNSTTLYFREENSLDFTTISDVSVLDVNIQMEDAETDSVTLLVYYKGEEIVLPVVRGRRPNGAMFTDLISKETLKIFAEDLLSNEVNMFDDNAKDILNLAINKGVGL